MFEHLGKDRLTVSDSSVLHLRIPTELSARINERVHVLNERNFPQAKLDSEIKARFLLNDPHNNLYFYGLIIVYIFS